MKNHLFFLFVFLVLSCNSVDPDPNLNNQDEFTSQANLLNGIWLLKDPTSAVKDGSIILDFKDLNLIFSNGSNAGGNFSTLNSVDFDVWPNSGSWEFQNNDKSKLIRSDNVVLSISLSNTILRITFTVSGGLKEGNWTFDFIKKQ